MKKYKLLYAEDEENLRKNHLEYIKHLFDFDIFEASNGKEALELYHTHKPDILLTDISMPYMCGLELIEKIRKNDNDIHIIILSAHSEKEKLLKAIKLNLQEYHIKPIDRKILKNSLSNSIKKLDSFNKNLFYFNNIDYFDKNTQNLIVDNNIITLSKNELKLFNIFLSNPNILVSSLDIFNEIWDFEKEYKIDSIRTLVKKLRKILPTDCIESIYGGGYKLIC